MSCKRPINDLISIFLELKSHRLRRKMFSLKKQDAQMMTNMECSTCL